MESTKEAVIGKGKRPKSPTRYPKRMPTYVVAFAVQETLDDPHKLEQIANKRSADSPDSIKSISPTDSTSTKTFTISPTETLPSVLDETNLKEVKIDIVDENQCGDVTEKKSTQFSNYIVIDKRTADEQPEIIFNAPKHIKRCKENNKYPRKKPKKGKRVIKFTNIHFKYKKPKNSITRRLEKYYETANLNTPNAEQIQEQIYCNDLSMVVSRSRALKKVLAKENLLADSEQISSHDDVSFDYDESLHSSPPSAKKSFISHTSQKTLVYKESCSSRNEEKYSSIKAANSVNQVTSDKQDADQTAGSSNEKLMHKENLTSSETFLQNNTTELTSKSSFSEEPKSYKIDYNDLSPNLFEKVQNNDTIIQAVKPIVEWYNENETFANDLISPDFNKSSISCNLQINSETTGDTENVQSSLPTNDNFSNDISKNNTLLDKVKTLGFYPMKASLSGSGSNINCESNDVLVTDNINDTWSFTRDTKNISDDCPTDTKKISVLRKLVEVKNMSYLQNNIYLPDDVAIKAKLVEKKEEKRSCADEVGNKYPRNMGEMWEQLILVIDLTVKRLEEAIVQRIVNDIRESLPIFNQPEHKVPTAEITRGTTTATVNDGRPIPTMLHKAVFVKEEHLKLNVNVCVQCDLVQKQVIDQLMLQLSLVPKPIPASEEVMKILEPSELLNTEVLKPPVAYITDSVSVEEGKGETATVSTATTELSTVRSFRRLKRLISCPMEVLRENMVIMTSVPTFFIVLLCLYGVIVVVMKPW